MMRVCVHACVRACVLVCVGACVRAESLAVAEMAGRGKRAIVVVVRTELSQQMLSSKASLFRVPIDFIVYRRGGALVQHGQDVYAGGLVGKLPFTYPPFSAWLFSSFSQVPAVVGAVLWQFGAFLLLLIILINLNLIQWRIMNSTTGLKTLEES